jgi:hypothetical protein
MAVLTLADAKTHLRITDNDHDSDVTQKLQQASAIVVDFVLSGRTRWTDPGTPADDPIVQSAILDVLTGLYEHRGDDYGVDAPDEELWNAITRRLARLRDPAIA